MAVRNKKTKSWIEGGFIAITYQMMDSKAFRAMNVSALKAFIFCMRKVKVHDPVDRFKYHFSLTYPEAKKHGLTDSTFFRGMKQLQDLGFIVCVMKGGLDSGIKKPTLYRLSQKWKDYGTPNFKKLHDGYSEVIHG
jgi:hypothetical protein